MVTIFFTPFSRILQCFCRQFLEQELISKSAGGISGVPFFITENREGYTGFIQQSSK